MSETIINPTAVISFSAQVQQGAVQANVYQAPLISLVPGSAVGTFPLGDIDKIASVPFAVTSGTPFTFNLISGLDVYGNALGMAHLLGLVIENDSVTAAQIMVLGGGTHSALGSDQITIQPGGSAGVSNPNPGYTVTSSSTDTLTITVASGTAVAGILTVWGRST